jgi:RNA polymerase sigma-70 factor (ECF subfamily)
VADLVAVLDPQVTLTSDGGGEVTAARRPVHGAERVARFVLGTAAKRGGDDEIRVVEVNGFSGVGLYRRDRLTGVISVTVDEGRISRVDIIRAPQKLLAGSGRDI